MAQHIIVMQRCMHSSYGCIYMCVRRRSESRFYDGSRFLSEAFGSDGRMEPSIWPLATTLMANKYVLIFICSWNLLGIRILWDWIKITWIHSIHTQHIAAASKRPDMFASCFGCFCNEVIMSAYSAVSSEYTQIRFYICTEVVGSVTNILAAT